MDEAHIAELLEPFLTWPLSERQLRHISTYIDMLLKWNQRINLTAIRGPEEIVTRHFGESLFAAQQLFPARAHAGAPGATSPLQRRAGVSAEEDVASNVSTVVDVGSGAGFPGLPIKIWAPDLRLTLIESNHKKSTFLKEVVRELGEGAQVFADRADRFPAAFADVVTLRAVERFENVLTIAAGLVMAGGKLALLIGNTQIRNARTIARNFEWQSISVPISQNRVLLIGKKKAYGD
ncbi:MAG TPA: 16S rRNA (guanine(527)-N(7))-methyltransferase RsmG [Terriglobales bacterium]|nr:16S rRNA (guanine(527)-N(7))-methyltransferase RsmG [Terriglobales bacterium]